LRDFITVDNPVALKDVVAYTERLNNPLTLHHSVVLTGGEPLVQAEFASALASVLRQGGIRIFLETNGSLPDKLHLILPFVDYISMDIKLASSAGGPDLLETHKAFLQQALSANVYVKIVLTSDTSTEELLRAVRMVHSIDPAIPLVLQPATNCSGRFSPSAGQVLEWQKQCKAFLQNVRVIPQCHRIIGQL
jgi:organic radical activating enzyme